MVIMIKNIQNILYVVAAVILLFGGVFILRGAFKFVWKIFRAGLVLVILLLIAGILLGFINLNIL